MGPPTLVAGGESQKSTVAIAALARALFQLDLVAITMYTKSKNGKPVLGGLFPKQDQMQKYYHHAENKNGTTGGGPLHLLILELPFANDVKKGLPRSDWQDEVEELMEAYEQQDRQHKPQRIAANNEMATLCDNLIDSLMLSATDNDGDDDDDNMNIYNKPVSISNPLAASWQQTIIQRILDPNAPIVDARCGTINIRGRGRSHSSTAASAVTDALDMDMDSNNEEDAMQDPMGTPPDILKRAHESLAAFYKAFPAPKTDPKNANKKRKASS
jgi:Ku70/Ku80 beta-barrel domain